MNLLEKQPESCRLPLPEKEIAAATPDYVKRIILADPRPFYERIQEEHDPLVRYNAVNFMKMFPMQEGVCACGCGAAVKGKKQFATPLCQRYAVGVWSVLNGRTDYIGSLLRYYYGDTCVICNINRATDADHIIAVANGGGGSWLSNYQWICNECHKEKTRNDFGWTKLKTTK